MNDQSETQVDTTTVETATTNEHENTISNGEGEAAPETQSTEQRQPETSEQRIARLKRQLEREQRKLGIDDKEGSQETNKKGSEVDERFARQDLKLAGITDKKEQDIVMKYARTEGIEDLEKAAKHPIVKAALDYHRAQTSTPAPSTRTGAGASNSLEYWAEQAKKGNLPSDPDMRRQLRKMRIFAR